MGTSIIPAAHKFFSDKSRIEWILIGSMEHKLDIACGSVADPDPGLGAFLTTGSGIRDGRNSASGSGMNNPDHIF
jgi:hypothetical protein